MNWRGGEGSQTDLAIAPRFQKAAESQNPTTQPSHESRQSDPYTVSSTGLVYMQARYYEPETGRFTQADQISFQIGDFSSGQHNRWIFCANDPVNCSDPEGLDYGGYGAVAASFGYLTGYFYMSAQLGLNPITFFQAFMAWSVDMGLSAVAGGCVGSLTNKATMAADVMTESTILGIGIFSAFAGGAYVGATMALMFAIDQGLF